MSHTPPHERHVRCTVGVFWLSCSRSTHWWVLFLVFDGGCRGFPHLGFRPMFIVLDRVEASDMGCEKEESQSSIYLGHKRDREGRVLVELCAPHLGHGIEELRQRGFLRRENREAEGYNGLVRESVLALVKRC